MPGRSSPPPSAGPPRVTRGTRSSSFAVENSGAVSQAPTPGSRPSSCRSTRLPRSRPSARRAGHLSRPRASPCGGRAGAACGDRRRLARHPQRAAAAQCGSGFGADRLGGRRRGSRRLDHSGRSRAGLCARRDALSGPPRRARAEGHRHEVDRSSGVADVNGGGAPARPRITCADRAADCTACRAQDHYGQDQGADRPTVPRGLDAGRRATVSRACGAPVFRAPRRDRNILPRAPALIDRTTQSKMENAMGGPVGYPRCKHKGICHG